MNAVRRVRRVTVAGSALLDRSRIRTVPATLPSRLLPPDALGLLTRSSARAAGLRAPVGDLDAVLQVATARDAAAGPAPGDERVGRGALAPLGTVTGAAAQDPRPPAARRRPAGPDGAATVSNPTPGGALHAAPPGRPADAAGDGWAGRRSGSSPARERRAVGAGPAGAHAELAETRAWPVTAAAAPPAPLPPTSVEGRARPSRPPAATVPAGHDVVEAVPAAGGHGAPDPEPPGLRTDGLAGLVNRWRSVGGPAVVRSATVPAAHSPAGRGEPGGDAPGGPPPAARPGPPAVPDAATAVLGWPSGLGPAAPTGAEVIGLADASGAEAATAEQDRLEQLLDELVRREALANGLEDLP